MGCGRSRARFMRRIARQTTSTTPWIEPCRCTHAYQIQRVTACTKNRARGARGSDVMTCIWTVVPTPL